VDPVSGGRAMPAARLRLSALHPRAINALLPVAQIGGEIACVRVMTFTAPH
jgi:hypothetical protein